MNLPPEYLKERFEMILRYENPPSNSDLLDIIKRAFANMGYDTPEKRKEWHRNQRPFIWAAEISKDTERDSEGN